MAHGPVVGVAFEAGVMLGAVASMIFAPYQRVVGFSAGVYCVLGVHFGHLLLHWRTCDEGALNRWMRLLIFAVFFGVDVVYSYAAQVSATIHLAGFVVGVVLSAAVLRDLQRGHARCCGARPAATSSAPVPLVLRYAFSAEPHAARAGLKCRSHTPPPRRPSPGSRRPAPPPRPRPARDKHFSRGSATARAGRRAAEPPRSRQRRPSSATAPCLSSLRRRAFGFGASGALALAPAPSALPPWPFGACSVGAAAALTSICACSVVARHGLDDTGSSSAACANTSVTLPAAAPRPRAV